MNAVYLAGRGLACSLGLDMPQALAALQYPVMPSSYPLPGSIAGSYPFYAIPFCAASWNERARQLICRVAEEAGAEQARQGVLFIATSSLDIGAAEEGAAELNLDVFADKIAGWLEWQGPVYVVSTACTSGLNAMLAAHAMLRGGEMEEALVLGLELENKVTMGGFAALQLLSPTSCQPFGAARDGLVLGEAVAALRLSTRETAQWRMLGGANVVDGSQPTGASLAAVVTMYQRALAESGLELCDIDLIKVQAAGSPSNDEVEAQALRQAFSELPALLSLKAALGHTMGASGAAEIALLTACLEHEVWPQCASETNSSLEINLAARAPQAVRRVLATILGFGGGHATVVLERSA
jgi:3-oxoacyl-[acyl-carrier-protein] synthase-1